MPDLGKYNWEVLLQSMWEKGHALLPGMLSPAQCSALQTDYDNAALYRTTISMARYRFGRGEYKYFTYPLPPLVQELRVGLYEKLAPLANQWMVALNIPVHYPAAHDEFVAICNQHEQLRPTPLILKYEAGGYNTLHQDLYGEIYFPFQVVFVLSRHGVDYEGGELVFVEQVPRAQSKAMVLTPNQGDAVVFTTQFRPAQGSRGYYRAAMKHGISEVASGQRFALGVIFHDGK
jgi:uncharacterized protein